MATTSATQNPDNQNSASVLNQANLAVSGLVSSPEATEIIKPSATEIEALKTYISQNNDLAQKNILASYAKDSDGDGLIDKQDSSPNSWNVSDRDLRMLMALSDRPGDLQDVAGHKSRLENIFNEKLSGQDFDTLINEVNKNQLADQADAKELSGNWDLLDRVHTESGLDYAIFGNGKTENGYQNVVVTFEGTKGEWWEADTLLNESQILFGNMLPQTADLEKVAQEVAAYHPDKVYATGHSLGGYLAQYFAAYTMQSQTEWAESFVRSVLFNPAALNNTNLLINNNSLNSAVANTRAFLKTDITDNGDIHQKTKSLVIEGDWVDWMNKYRFKNLFESSIYQPTIYFPNVVEKNYFFRPNPFDNPQHLLDKFFFNTPELEKQFSQGYRVDAHYQAEDDDLDGLANVHEKHIGTAVDNADSDGDGYSDYIEAALASNALDSAILPSIPVASQNNTATQPEVSALNLQNDENTSNSIISESLFNANGLITGVKIIGTQTDDVITGGEGDDILQGGSGSDTVTGGAGRDTFVFHAGDVDDQKADILTDFNPQEDLLDVSNLRALFEDHGNDLQWSQILMDSTATVDTNQSHLILNSEEKTLSYQAAGSETTVVIAHFDTNQAAALTAANLIG